MHDHDAFRTARQVLRGLGTYGRRRPQTRPGPTPPPGPGLVVRSGGPPALPCLLGPSEATPDGLPGVYAESGDASGEVLGPLYDAAFGPEAGNPDPGYRIFATVDHEEGRNPSLEAAGVYVGEHKDRLLFSEPSLPLPEISCSNLADLRRLHARVLSAALRV